MMRSFALGVLLLYPLTASADPSGKRWPLAPCVSGCPTGTTCVSGRCAVQFRQAASIDNAGGLTINGGVSYATVVARTEAAFAAWTQSRLSCSTVWNSVPTASFSSPAGRSAVNANDDLNNIIWLSGSAWAHLPTELGLTTVTYGTSTNQIFDADMELNNNVTWSTTAAPNTYDPESVIIHEAGHFLGLDHSANASTVMYFQVTQGSTKRVLTAGDENDVCTVYPASAGAMGTPCETDAQCTAPLACRGRAGATAKICAQVCNDPQAACPTGYTCQNATSSLACLPQVGVADQCKFCQSGEDCNSGLCLRFDSGVTFCSLSCSDSTQCGPNYDCQLPEGYCVPRSMTCTNQCTTSSQCATGYTCNQGTCTPTGAPGDICTVSLYCAACSVCTRETAASPLSFCRPCCDGAGQGGFCDACTSTGCASGSMCAALSVGNSSVCVPGTAKPLSCEPCNQGACADGLLCLGGRCRAPCNPETPGTCPACFILPNAGVCACGDELAYEGQACGQVTDKLAACASGLACVGQPERACRLLCNLNDPGSCRVGQSCQLVSGLAVCVPGSAGTQCAACTNVGLCNSGLTCYLGRCYQPCDVNQPEACSSCVQTTTSGAGVCGCDDQLSPEGGPCGALPTGVRACANGTQCVNGTCGAPSVGTGGGAGGGGGTSSGKDGGTGGGGGSRPTNLGCGCGAIDGPIALAALLLAAMRRWRHLSV